MSILLSEEEEETSSRKDILYYSLFCFSHLNLTMLSRALRHSKSAPILRAQVQNIHISTPVKKPSAAALTPVRTPTTPSSSTRPVPTNFKNKTVNELKVELKARGLKTSGRKDEVCVCGYLFWQYIYIYLFYFIFLFTNFKKLLQRLDNHTANSTPSPLQ